MNKAFEPAAPHVPTSAREDVPFCKAGVVGDEIARMREALERGAIAGDGPFSKRCHELLQKELGVARALLTTSCTHALEMAALLLELKPGDEVIVPSFTFVSTANAFVLHGAKVVFADIRPDTLNLDERQLESLITSRTRAVVPVHYAGVGCEMDAIMEIASRRGITVVEDNAHGLFARYRGRYLGTFGALATQSFHETKNFTCGEGGALILNDASLVERAEVLREKGTDRSRYYQGLVDKYSWRDVGSSYLMSDLLAAFLFEQLSARDTIQTRRRAIFDRYDEELRAWAAGCGVTLPVIPAHCEQAHHMFALMMPTAADRTAVIRHLKMHRVNATFHYVPLNTSPMGLQLGGRTGQCPVTEDRAARLVRLPFFTGMTASQQSQVIEAVLSFRPQ